MCCCFEQVCGKFVAASAFLQSVDVRRGGLQTVNEDVVRLKMLMASLSLSVRLLYNVVAAPRSVVDGIVRIICSDLSAGRVDSREGATR